MRVSMNTARYSILSSAVNIIHHYQLRFYTRTGSYTRNKSFAGSSLPADRPTDWTHVNGTYNSYDWLKLPGNPPKTINKNKDHRTNYKDGCWILLISCPGLLWPRDENPNTNWNFPDCEPGCICLMLSLTANTNVQKKEGPSIHR